MLYNESAPGYANCTSYNQHINLDYKTCVDVFRAVQPITNSSVTLVTQTTFNRFESVKRMALQWRGAMSVAFYLTSTELQFNTTEIQQWIVGTGRRNIAVHFMIKRGVSEICFFF